MRASRIACVRVPDFALAWWLARHPEFSEVPVVLAEGQKAASPVLAVNSAAHAYDVRPGLSVSQARARAKALHVQVRDPKSEHDLSRRIVASLQSVTPAVEEDAPGLWFLESLGQGRLYGGERRFIRHVFDTLAPFALPVCVGLAGHRDVARVAAQVSSPRTFLIVPTGSERKFLAALPSHHAAAPSLAPYLRALGLDTMAQVAELPASQWAARFGSSGVQLQKLAQGLEGSPFAPETLTEPLRQEAAFDFPLFSSITLVERAEALLTPLLAVLASRQEAAYAVHVEFDLENRENVSWELALSTPVCVTAPFARQLSHALGLQPPRAGVRGIVVQIESSGAAPVEQLEWSHRPERVVPRELPHRSGEWRTPRALSAALPEAAAEWHPTEAPTPKAGLLADAPIHLPCLSSAFGLRLFSPPQRVTAVWSNGALSTLESPALHQRVQAYHGPWVVSGHWWRQPFHRLYYEVDTAGPRYLVYYDRAAGHWYVQGVFD